MNKRLAQIIAASIGPDGKPDREKIFDALSVTPGDPTALLIEAFMAADGSFQGLKLEQAKNVKAIEEALQRELLQLLPAFGAHKRALENAKAELGTAFAMRSDQLEAYVRQLAAQAVVSTAAAEKAVEAAERLAAASVAAVKKMNESAANVEKAHAAAVLEIRGECQKLQDLTKKYLDRDQIIGWIICVIAGLFIGGALVHWWIEPHWHP